MIVPGKHAAARLRLGDNALRWRGAARRGLARLGGSWRGKAWQGRGPRWQHRGLSLVWRPRRNELMPSLKALDRPRAHDAAQDAMTAKPLRPAASSKARPRPSSRDTQGKSPNRQKNSGPKCVRGGPRPRPIGRPRFRPRGPPWPPWRGGLLGRTSEGPLQGAEWEPERL
jgi:hypothetical protein